MASAAPQMFMGDDTWMQMVPGSFQSAAPFESFNVKDLHTVDSGVWQVSGLR
jgi:phosphatidylinositol glycan class O